MSPTLRRFAAVLLAVACASCAPDVPATPAPPAPTPPLATPPPVDSSRPDVRVQPADASPAARLAVAPIGSTAETDLPRVFVEVVATNAARRRGLGGRTELPADQGMLFVYAYSQPKSFWMKDCAIALDIAFLDERGRILQVATLGPGTGRAGQEVPRVTCAQPVRYVLETNAGYLGELGVGTGDLVDLGAAIAGVVPE